MHFCMATLKRIFLCNSHMGLSIHNIQSMFVICAKLYMVCAKLLMLGMLVFPNSYLQKGFLLRQSDHSLFVRHTHNSVTILLLYVDDILITGSDTTFISQLLQSLHSQFDMRNLGELKHFLGIEFI